MVYNLAIVQNAIETIWPSLYLITLIFTTTWLVSTVAYIQPLSWLFDELWWALVLRMLGRGSAVYGMGWGGFTPVSEWVRRCLLLLILQSNLRAHTSANAKRTWPLDLPIASTKSDPEPESNPDWSRYAGSLPKCNGVISLSVPEFSPNFVKIGLECTSIANRSTKCYSAVLRHQQLISSSHW